MGERILVIVADIDMGRKIGRCLGDAGYLIDLVHDGATGLEKAQMGFYNLVIFDSASSGMTGSMFCRRVRDGGYRIPLVILDDSSEELERVLCLELGADDYVAKPFSLRELTARVGAVLRRTGASVEEFGSGGTLRTGSLTIDLGKRSVLLDRKPLQLTVKEFDLLRLFAENPGKTFTRSQLLRKVWGYQNNCYEHTVNSHINRLRAKIEQDSGHPCYILTVWGVGYKFREADSDIP